MINNKNERLLCLITWREFGSAPGSLVKGGKGIGGIMRERRLTRKSGRKRWRLETNDQRPKAPYWGKRPQTTESIDIHTWHEDGSISWIVITFWSSQAFSKIPFFIYASVSRSNSTLHWSSLGKVDPENERPLSEYRQVLSTLVSTVWFLNWITSLQRISDNAR